MWDLYPQNYVKKSFDEDWPTLLEIHDALEPEREEDLIKRQALGYVVWQIEETYKINKGELYQKTDGV